MGIPHNKYCIDCKKNLSTHCVVWLGSFVCKDCAAMHRMQLGGQSFTYIKDVFKEHWDDYQLRSVCIGGNKPLFELLKEYGIDNDPIQSRYKHACINWYRKRHIALMDNREFTLAKPPRDWDERLQMTKS